MGLRDRLEQARRRRRSPMTLALAAPVPGTQVRAGEATKVAVVVGGEDDGTTASIGLYLRMLGWQTERALKWPLGELPTTLGTHELEVEIPTGLAPACARLTEYALVADLRRTEGHGVSAATVVDVIGRAEDLYWPEGPRSGREGPEDIRIRIELDEETVGIGGRLTGRVVLQAAGGGDVVLEVGPELDTLVGVTGSKARPRFSPAVVVTLGEAGSTAASVFDVEIPVSTPPTLYDGDRTSIVWQARVTLGAATAWRLFGVLDPAGHAGRGEARPPALLTFLAKLAGDVS